MKLRLLFLLTLLFAFSGQTFAASVDEWVTKTITGDLKPTAGCKDKAKAQKQTAPGSYRFKKYSTILCNEIAYGWGKDKVLENGEMVCEPCEGSYEGKEKYRCYMKDVKVQCKIVKRSF